MSSDSRIEKAARAWWLDNYRRYEDQPDRDQDIAGLDGFRAGADWVLRNLEEEVLSRSDKYRSRLMQMRGAGDNPNAIAYVTGSKDGAFLFVEESIRRLQVVGIEEK